MKLYKNIRVLKKDNLLKLDFYDKIKVLYFNTVKGHVEISVSHIKVLETKNNLKFFVSNKSFLKQFISFFDSFLEGISKGFFFELSLRGIGFKCYYFDKHKLFLSLGYSHYIIYTVPSDVVVFLKKGRIFLYTLSKELLGTVVADLKNLRIPDAYKAKGIVESNKLFSLKEGKKR
jgi:large subunit ribosomal protein L6